jgi:predicted pyridoxine 5'-phosphate oxidase superfamily flavin-nucleotide-binding protein
MMDVVKVTEEMKELLATGLAVVGTADRKGRPNIAPKGSLRLEDDETLVFAEGSGKKTLHNLRENPQVTVATVNREKMSGYQFKGKAELVEAGPLYDAVAKAVEARGRPKPLVAVKIKIEEIYSLKPGPKAGERVA